MRKDVEVEVISGEFNVVGNCSLTNGNYVQNLVT